jgi:hypothetical protein
MFSRFYMRLLLVFTGNTERSKGGSVVISHSFLVMGQGWAYPYILLSLEASALLRQYTQSSLSTGYEPGPAPYSKPLRITSLLRIISLLRTTSRSHITSHKHPCLSFNMVTEMHNSKFGSIEKLSSDNYDTWKPRISAILSAMLTLKIVTGEETEEDLPLGNSLANVVKRESYKRQVLATTAILLSCTYEVSTYLSSITDPKAIVGYARRATQQRILI